MLDGRPFLYSNIVEILLALGARTILWGGDTNIVLYQNLVMGAILQI